MSDEWPAPPPTLTNTELAAPVASSTMVPMVAAADRSSMSGQTQEEPALRLAPPVPIPRRASVDVVRLAKSNNASNFGGYFLEESFAHRLLINSSWNRQGTYKGHYSLQEVHFAIKQPHQICPVYFRPIISCTCRFYTTLWRLLISTFWDLKLHSINENDTAKDSLS